MVAQQTRADLAALTGYSRTAKDESGNGKTTRSRPSAYRLCTDCAKSNASLHRVVRSCADVVLCAMSRRGANGKAYFSSKFQGLLGWFTCQLVRPDLALYVLLKPFRAFVTVKEPSICAETLTNMPSRCALAVAVRRPGLRRVIGATGMLSCWSSIVLAMNIPGTVYSWPLRSEK